MEAIYTAMATDSMLTDRTLLGVVWVRTLVLSVREASVPFCEAYTDPTPWTCGLGWDLSTRLHRAGCKLT